MGKAIVRGLVGVALAACAHLELFPRVKYGSGGSCELLIAKAEESERKGYYEVALLYLDEAVDHNKDDSEGLSRGEACYPVRLRARILYESGLAEEEVHRGSRDWSFIQRIRGEYERALGLLQQSQKGDVHLETLLENKIFLLLHEEDREGRAFRERRTTAQ